MLILTEPEERLLFLNTTILSYPMTVLDASADRISSEVPRVGGEKVADTSIRHPGTVRGTGPAEKLAFVDTLTTTCRYALLNMPHSAGTLGRDSRHLG